MDEGDQKVPKLEVHWCCVGCWYFYEVEALEVLYGGGFWLHGFAEAVVDGNTGV